MILSFKSSKRRTVVTPVKQKHGLKEGKNKLK